MKDLKNKDLLLALYVLGNNLAWSYIREGEVFLKLFTSSGTTFEHFPAQHTAIGIKAAMRVIGFQEIPVYKNWGSLSKEERKGVDDLYARIESHIIKAGEEAVSAQAKAEAAIKAANEQAEGSENEPQVKEDAPEPVEKPDEETEKEEETEDSPAPQPAAVK